MNARTFDIKEVSGNKAYSSRENLDLVNGLGAKTYIPQRQRNWRSKRLYVLEQDVSLLHAQQGGISETTTREATPKLSFT